MALVRAAPTPFGYHHDQDLRVKELLRKNFWRDVKRTFDEAREGPQEPQSTPSTPAVATGTAPAAGVEPRGILFDLDGVLYDADRPIAGAAETVEWVQSLAVRGEKSTFFGTGGFRETKIEMIQRRCHTPFCYSPPTRSTHFDS
jgi:hypothetical protein